MSANDPKFDFQGGRLISRDSGPVPEDEPVFILRARDRHAAAAIRNYMTMVRDPTHAEAVRDRLVEFERFIRLHPDRMNEPDTSSASRRVAS